MKSRVMYMMLLVVALVSTSAWALVWDINDPANLVFNLNFEIHTHGTPGVPPTTTDAGPNARVGTLVDYNDNAIGRNVWESIYGIRRTSADFNSMHDIHPYGGDTETNDCNISVVWPPGPGAGHTIFDFGKTTTDKHTWTFWFNDVDANEPGDSNKTLQPGRLFQPTLQESTFIRHQQVAVSSEWEKYWWEIRVNNGKLEFRHGLGYLTFETVSPLKDLGAPGVPDRRGHVNPNSTGVDPNTWHHAAVVIDRSTETASKMYIDGLEVPVIIKAYTAPNSGDKEIDAGHTSPVRFGTGEYEFDGMLDEIRLYNRALTSLEISLIDQNNPDVVQPYAQSPIPRTVGVSMATGLSWYPIPTATAQTVKFGTDPALVNNIITINLNGTASSATNAQIGGTLNVSTTYYWRVNSTVGGNPNTGPIWSFTIETGKAANPDPYDGEQDVDNSGTTDLSWTTSLPSGRTFDVYFGDDPGALLRIENDITALTVLDEVTSVGKTYYWRVNTLYTDFTPDINVQGDLWSFRTEPYKIVFNTDDGPAACGNHNVPGLTCELKGIGGAWDEDPLATGSLDGDVAVFNFPDGFDDYDSTYDIVVVPEYSAPSPGAGNDATAPPTPLGIHVTGNFSFDGKMDISGSDANPLANQNDSTTARCGGHRGPRREKEAGDDGPEYALGYQLKKLEYENRQGDNQAHYYYPPTTSGYGVFGPGNPLTAPYKCGGGGGYGGTGGDGGRGYWSGISTRGASYGDEEVPVPFGGSSGSWGQSVVGGAGGGGVEIIATGNVTLGSNAKILADGGTHPYPVQYPSGGGAGGSVRIIAGGNVSNSGVIDVNGGDGGDGNQKSQNTGGGGAGGRVAIFYGGSCTPQGTITANGGAKGIIIDSGFRPRDNGCSLAEDGQDGTIYIKDSDVVSVKKASAPTPMNGEYLVYAPGSSTSLALKWYSGYCDADDRDRVWFGTSEGSLAAVGTVGILATRSQHSVNVNVDPNQTYYWRVKTDSNSVLSDLFSFKTVKWQCQGPDWNESYSLPANADKAGWPAWDQNHDCIVNDLDLWYFAKDWEVYRGEENKTDEGDLLVFLDEWMTCRARTDSGCNTWPLTQDYLPPEP